MLGGVTLAAVLVASLTQYDAVRLYEYSIAYHRQWRGWDGSFRTLTLAGTTNIIEYFVWVGIPVSVFFTFSVIFSIRKSWCDKNFTSSAASVLGVLACFIFLFLFATTKGEVARIWLFLTPLMLVSVATYLDQFSRTSGFTTPSILAIFFTLQFITNILILRYQDFY